MLKGDFTFQHLALAIFAMKSDYASIGFAINGKYRMLGMRAFALADRKV